MVSANSGSYKKGPLKSGLGVVLPQAELVEQREDTQLVDQDARIQHIDAVRVLAVLLHHQARFERVGVLHDAGIFQFLCGFLSRLGLTVPLSGALLTMGLEITAGVSQCVYWHLPVYFLAFGLGFSGVCIHLQIFSFFHKAGLPLSKTRYVLARFLNGLLSAAFYLLLSYFLPANTSVAVETSPLNTAPMAGSAASSLALIALSVFFLLTCILRSGKTPSKICGGNSTGKMLQ